jgi:hypothetical protein
MPVSILDLLHVTARGTNPLKVHDDFDDDDIQQLHDA